MAVKFFFSSAEKRRDLSAEHVKDLTMWPSWLRDDARILLFSHCECAFRQVLNPHVFNDLERCVIMRCAAGSKLEWRGSV
jgi:hypothetical protein